jgi:MFS family permease
VLIEQWTGEHSEFRPHGAKGYRPPVPEAKLPLPLTQEVVSFMRAGQFTSVWEAMPMNQKPSRMFYGWWIVGASVVTGLYAAGAVFYGFTAIFEPIANDMHWSYTQISLASSLRGLEAGLLAPVIGVLVDRWGPRRLIFSGTLITVGGLLMLSQTSSLGMFYGAFTIIAIGMSCCTMTVLMTAVSNWFHRRIGLATGIAVSGFGLGGLLVPVIVSLTEAYEWRMAIIVLAMGMLVIVLPLSLLFRHKPEHYGYLPDGQPNQPSRAAPSGILRWLSHFISR